MAGSRRFAACLPLPGGRQGKRKQPRRKRAFVGLPAFAASKAGGRQARQGLPKGPAALLSSFLKKGRASPAAVAAKQDVYKRQEHCRSHDIEVVARYFHVGEAGLSPKAVSYTHLDVYKRQQLVCRRV